MKVTEGNEYSKRTRTFPENQLCSRNLMKSTNIWAVLFGTSSSSSCRGASTDIPDPLSPLLPIVHRLRKVFRATSRILTQLLNVCSSWSSCFCPAICGGPQEYITYKLVPASPAVSCMSSSSNLDCFRDGRQLAVQLVLCGMLPPGLSGHTLDYSKMDKGGTLIDGANNKEIDDDTLERQYRFYLLIKEGGRGLGTALGIT